MAEQLIAGVKLLSEILHPFVLLETIVFDELACGWFFLQHFLIDIVVTLAWTVLSFLIATLHK